MSNPERNAESQRRSALALRKRGGNKISTTLVALSSSAVLAVYAVGYARTQSAESQLTTPGTGAATIDQAAPSTAGSSVQLPSGRVPASAGSTAPSTSNGGNTTAPSAPRTSSAQAAGYRDGTYVGTGTSRHGSVEATVVVEGGKIVSAAISKCGTRYPCSYIASLPAQVVSRQGPPVNLISGATDSSTAYRQAISAALARAGAA